MSNLVAFIGVASAHGPSPQPTAPGHFFDGHFFDGHFFDGRFFDGTFYRRDSLSTGHIFDVPIFSKIFSHIFSKIFSTKVRLSQVSLAIFIRTFTH